MNYAKWTSIIIDMPSLHRCMKQTYQGVKIITKFICNKNDETKVKVFQTHRSTWIKYHKNTITVEKHLYKSQNKRKGRKGGTFTSKKARRFFGTSYPKHF